MTCKVMCSTSAAVIAVCVGMASGVAAQPVSQGATTATALSSAGAGAGSPLPEIVVTARKRSETIQSIPATVDAVTAQGLANTGVQELGDLQNEISGLRFANQGGAQPLVSLRGDFNRVGVTDSGLGVYLDGVYLTRYEFLSQDPLDPSRVELIKGPQSTLYGKNTVAGAMNIISMDPTFSYHGELDAGYGGSSEGENLYHEAGFLSGPINDQLAFRIAAENAYRSGYVVNDSNGIRGLGYNDNSVRAKLLYKPTSKLQVEFTGYYDKKNAPRADVLGGGYGNLAPFQNPRLSLPISSGPTIWNWSANTAPYSESEAYLFSADVKYSTLIGQLESITAYQHLTLHQLTDLDTTQYPIAAQDVFDKDGALSEELRLSGSANRFTWLGGLYYLDDRDSGLGQIINFGPDSVQYAGHVAQQFATAPSFTHTYAAFAQGGVDLTSHLNILGGVRYSEDDRKFPTTFYDTTTTGTIIPGAFYNLARSKDFPALTGNAVATWRFDQNVRAYASFATGEKAGGFSSIGNAAAAVIPYDDEYVYAYEVGFKSDLLERRLRFNVDAFYNDYSNLQIARSVQVAEPGGTFGQFNLEQNAASSTVPGVDLEIIYQISRTLRAHLNYTYQHAVINNFEYSSSVTLHDVPVPRSPLNSGNVGLEYADEVGPGHVVVGADGVFSSNFTNDINYTPPAPLLTAPAKGYGLLNLHGSYAWRNYELRAYVTNLLNHQYYAAGVIVASQYRYLMTPGAPQTFQFTLAAHF